MRKSLCMLLLAAAPLAGAEQVVKEFSGTGNTTTAMFTVEAPWLLDWRLDADYEQLTALDITLVEARGQRHVLLQARDAVLYGREEDGAAEVEQRP